APAPGIVATQRHKNATPLPAAGRAKLLDGAHPLAWGNAQVKLDAFMYGRVQPDRQLKIAIVTIKLFDKKPVDAPVDLMTFEAPITTTLLSDAGLTFYVARRGAEDKKDMTVVEPVGPEKIPMKD